MKRLWSPFNMFILLNVLAVIWPDRKSILFLYLWYNLYSKNIISKLLTVSKIASLNGDPKSNDGQRSTLYLWSGDATTYQPLTSTDNQCCDDTISDRPTKIWHTFQKNFWTHLKMVSLNNLTVPPPTTSR